MNFGIVAAGSDDVTARGGGGRCAATAAIREIAGPPRSRRTSGDGRGEGVKGPPASVAVLNNPPSWSSEEDRREEKEAGRASRTQH